MACGDVVIICPDMGRLSFGLSAAVKVVVVLSCVL
jgi:hypothetical protein